VPSSLRARFALLGLIGCLLIPIATTSLRGLTHVLTCEEAAATPFSIDVTPQGPVSTGSSVITRDDTGELCGGLRLDITVGSPTPNRASLKFSITNNTKYGWLGSVTLRLDGTDIPVDIGAIPSHQTSSDTVEVGLQQDKTYEIGGSLLIGP
jgi:hypothetical protein